MKKTLLIAGAGTLLAVFVLFAVAVSFPTRHEVGADLGELERIELWNGEFFVILTFHYERGVVRKTFWGIHHIIELKDLS